MNDYLEIKKIHEENSKEACEVFEKLEDDNTYVAKESSELINYKLAQIEPIIFNKYENYLYEYMDYEVVRDYRELLTVLKQDIEGLQEAFHRYIKLATNELHSEETELAALLYNEKVYDKRVLRTIDNYIKSIEKTKTYIDNKMRIDYIEDRIIAKVKEKIKGLYRKTKKSEWYIEDL